VLFSTHITSDLERVASHVALMKEGQVVFYDELDALKDQVKRLRLRCDADLPMSFAVRGALSTSVEGRHAVVTVPLVSDELLVEVRQRWSADVEIEDLNLEEIFLEMHESERAESLGPRANPTISGSRIRKNSAVQTLHRTRTRLWEMAP